MENKKKSIWNTQMKMEGTTHATLLVVIGGYLVYMAYQMVRDTLIGASSMSLTTTIILAGLMGLAGLCVVGYGAWTALKAMKEKKNTEKHDGEEVADEE